MERDQRMTGIKRGQSDKVEAPLGFEGEFREPYRRIEILLTTYSKQPMEGETSCAAVSCTTL